MKSTPNGTQLYRIEQLEKNFEKVDGKIDTLLENHLPHLRSDIESLKTKINVLTAINIGAVIFAIIASRLLK